MPTETTDLRVEAVRFVHQAAGVAFYTFAALSGAQYPKLLGLRSAAERALHRGALDEARRRAQELLELAEEYRKDWYYGNAVHHGHLVLGHVALAQQNLTAAGEHLLEAGRTPGSPQLNSFGPNMHLAQALLQAGQTEVVLQYLGLCRAFWRSAQPDRWVAQIREGRTPNFGANLIY